MDRVCAYPHGYAGILFASGPVTSFDGERAQDSEPVAPLAFIFGDSLMFRWLTSTKLTSTKRRRTRNKPLASKSRFIRLGMESLEDRITPAVTLLPPTIVDPGAAVRVDQPAYSVRGSLGSAATAATNVYVYRDSNQNGIFDAGQDKLAASGTI